MITEDRYKLLEQQISPYKQILGATSDTILDQDVSSYPIFVVHKQGINVGIPLDLDHIPGKLLINASALEEFVTKQLIESHKIEDFKLTIVFLKSRFIFVIM